MFPGTSFMTTMYYAFAGAAVGALLVFGIGFMSRGGMTPVRLTLAGAAVSYMILLIFT